jgi:hypothetical protein
MLLQPRNSLRKLGRPVGGRSRNCGARKLLTGSRVMGRVELYRVGRLKTPPIAGAGRKLADDARGTLGKPCA